MSSTKKKVAARPSATKKSARAKAPAKGNAHLVQRFGKEPGPTFEGLWAIRDELSEPDWGQELFYLLGDDEDKEVIATCREEYGLDILGRSHDQLCYFGFPRSWNASSLDAVPVVLVDNKGVDPEVAARNLAEFLSLVAYAPAAWGSTPEEWRSCAAEAAEAAPEDVERLQSLLVQIPGVVRTKTPWALQTKLPELTFMPKANKSAELTKQLASIFKEALDKWNLLLVFDEIELKGDAVRVGILLDAPDEVGSLLASHPSVRAKLEAFLARARMAFPSTKIKVRLTPESLNESPERAWRSLELACKHAGAPEIYAELAALRTT